MSKARPNAKTVQTVIVRLYYLDILKTYRDVPLVKILAGIRRCGKSTIFDMLKGLLNGFCI